MPDYNELLSMGEIVTQRRREGAKPFFVWYRDQNDNRTWLQAGNC